MSKDHDSYLIWGMLILMILVYAVILSAVVVGIIILWHNFGP